MVLFAFCPCYPLIEESDNMRVAIYIRVSTLDQAREGYSLAAQRAALEHWAADRRHEIVRVYEDAGIRHLLIAMRG